MRHTIDTLTISYKITTDFNNPEVANDALAYLNTFFKYYTILSTHSIDGRKPSYWGRFIIDSFGAKHGVGAGKLFFDVFSTYADNTELHGEFNSYPATYTVSSLIGEFESFYAGIDFKTLRANTPSATVLTEEYISRFGEEKGHNFLSVFYTTMNFLMTHPDGPGSDDYRSSWMQIADYYITEMFGQDALQEYVSVFEAENTNQETYLALFNELHAFHDEYFSILLIDAWSRVSELIL